MKHTKCPKKIDLRQEKYCVGIITDKIYGSPSFNRMSDQERKQIQKAAAGQGVTSPGGADYFAPLARFPGDPEAFCSNRTEIRDLVKRRGWKCEGMVEEG